MNGGALEPQARHAFSTADALEAVARQRLPAHDVAQFECKPFVGRETAGLEIKMPEIETPAVLLAPAVSEAPPPTWLLVEEQPLALPREPQI